MLATPDRPADNQARQLALFFIRDVVQHLTNSNLRKFLLLLMLFLLSGKFYAQEQTFRQVDSLAFSYVKDLINNSATDKILIYKTGCIGCEVIGDCSCDFGSLRTFLIWKETDHSYVKELNCCEATDKKQTHIRDIWNELETKEKQIFNSQFKSDFSLSHYEFQELILVKKDSTFKVEMADYFFAADNKHQKQNFIQPARKFQKMIESKLGE